MRILDTERKYIVESKVNEWDVTFLRAIARRFWQSKVDRMSEGDILKMYRELVDQNRPLAWLNGGSR